MVALRFPVSSVGVLVPVSLPEVKQSYAHRETNYQHYPWSRGLLQLSCIIVEQVSPALALKN
jgi:hypothetical protein